MLTGCLEISTGGGWGEGGLKSAGVADDDFYTCCAVQRDSNNRKLGTGIGSE